MVLVQGKLVGSLVLLYYVWMVWQRKRKENTRVYVKWGYMEMDFEGTLKIVASDSSSQVK